MTRIHYTGNVVPIDCSEARYIGAWPEWRENDPGNPWLETWYAGDPLRYGCVRDLHTLIAFAGAETSFLLACCKKFAGQR